MAKENQDISEEMGKPEAQSPDLELIEPNWPAPVNVRALITTRSGGVSEGAFSHFNLATHVGDCIEHVNNNREHLYKVIEEKVQWLQQVHSTDIVELHDRSPGAKPIVADGAFSTSKHCVCAVLSADCLPVLLCSKAGNWVAALHCGWRGLAAGIISNTINSPHIAANQLMAYLGPAISQTHFEVGGDVLNHFKEAARKRRFAQPVELFFTKSATSDDKFYADLYGLARSELNGLGLGMDKIYGGTECTFSNAKKFYSYRREKRCGRMASLIWIQN